MAIVVVAVLVLVAGGTYGYAEFLYHKIHRITLGSLTTVPTSQVRNILMVGNNTRCALNGQQSTSFGSCGDVGGARSDVIMILHVDPSDNQVSILSIPRDLLVPVPGHDELKVDSSLNYGEESLIQTLQQNFGIAINDYIELNFDTFQDIVTALGGMDLYFPDAVYDQQSGLKITQPGCYHLNGFQTLAEVRARHLYYLTPGTSTYQYDGDGDLSRIRRNHEFLRVLASDVESRGLSNPLTALSLVRTVAPDLTVDSGLSIGTMANLLEIFHGVNSQQIPQYTLPVVIGPDDYIYKGISYSSVVFPSQPYDQQTIDAWLGVTTPPNSSLAASGLNVQVVNASGVSGLGSKAETQLSELGFNVSDGGSQPVVGDPAETVIVYNPGEVAQAQRVAANFSGAVVLEQGTNPEGTDVVVEVTANSVVNSFAPGETVLPSASVTTVPPTVAPTPTTSRSGVTTTTVAPSTTTVPATTTTTSPIGPATNSDDPLQPWDPRACPAGSPVLTTNFS